MPDVKKTQAGSDLEAAARVRREAERRLSMSERLARVHELSKQLTAIRGRAQKP